MNSLQFLPPWLATVLIATLPVFELRGAIPFALAIGEPVFRTYILAVFGNLIPVIPLLLFLKPVSEYLRRFRLWHKFFEWLFKRTERRAEAVRRYEALGLIIFVAIPLPMTGAWTGSIAASLFKIKMKYALPCICIGVLIAGAVVTMVWLLGEQVVG